MENETDEQFEERVLNKRAAQMFVSVRSRMLKTDHLYLSEMTVKNDRKQVNDIIYFILIRILNFSYFTGCPKILFAASFKEISSSGY